jgi:Tfp pilus assembly protein PilN
MSRIQLDFTAPGERIGSLSWLLLAIGLCAAGALALTWQTADSAAHDARARLASLTALSAAKPASKTPPKRSDPAAEVRQRDETEAARALALPWGRLLSRLQDTRPDDIAFLSLDADGRRGDFQIIAEAKNYQAMLDYTLALQAESGFKAVSLMRHELHQIDGVQGVNFSLRGTWSGS